ncbi:hypothetical protein FQA39_LY13285 [Lamprigera yunnana]|nr:hypothetical protein FQA39_LY13285 [Lamprigera yunnana]
MKYLIVFVLLIFAVSAEENHLRQFSDGNVKFSANAYKELSKINSGNFVLCPMSVEIIFALVHAGARQSTAEQIAKSLQFPQDTETVQKIFKELSPKFQHNGFCNVSSANKVYIKKGFKVKQEFKDDAVNVFKSEVQEIDFSKKIAAVNEINSWVEEKTYNKIHDLLAENDIDELTRLVLINAMYFKGHWAQQFNVEDTEKHNFYLNNKDKIDIYMMEMTKRFNYYESVELNTKFLDITFLGGEFKMTFILPNEKEGLSRIEDHLEEALKEPDYKYEKVHVRIPKFKVESTLKLKPVLQKLGLVDAFEQKADFSGINVNPDERLHIDKVIQKTFIEVKEEGTTAAAATGILFAVGISAIIEPPVQPKQFIADHPFIFVLRHTNGILFVGRFVSGKE